MAAYTITDLPRGRRNPLRWRARRLWRKITRCKPAVRTVSVTITADVSGFLEQLQRASDATSQLASRFTEQRRLTDQLFDSYQALAEAVRFRRELTMIGGESRWYIRGAWAGSFVTVPPAGDDGLPPMTLQEARELDRDIQVQAMLHERLPARWVAAYLRGWVGEWGNDDREPYVRHTLIGTTAIEVSA